MGVLDALLALLPFGTAGALAWGRRRRGEAWDLSLGRALLAMAVLVLGFSEGASAAGHLSLGPALFFWGGSLAAALAWALSRPGRSAPSEGTAAGGFIWAALGLILLYLAALGVQAPVANFDSMLYHLPRVEQWAQNRSLAHFPTPYDLQVFYPPFAEMAILQTRLLSGGSDWAPLVQVTALLGCFAGLARLARTLGGGPWAALLAALALAALPMANLEAPTSQNDLVCALWLIWAAVFTLRYHQQGRLDDALWAALALGLGLASKGTFYIFGLPWGLGLAWGWLRHGRPRWAPLLLALLILAPSAGHWARNRQVSGTLMGSSPDHVVGRISAAGLASNVIKNLSYDALADDQAWNHRVHTAVAALHQAMGWALDDPQLIWAGLAYGHYFNFAGRWHEDYAGSPWHLAALLLIAAAVLAGWRRRTALPWLLLAAATGYAAYTGLIRFNPWCNRLHLPIFALLCAPIGLALEALLAPRGRLVAAAVLAAYAGWISVSHLALPWRLVLPANAAQAYSDFYYWRSGLSAGWHAASLGKNVGILNAERELEQPLWEGLRQAGARRVQHLNATPATAKALTDPRFAGFQPEVIVRNLPDKAPESFEWGGRRWQRSLSNELWAVYSPRP